MLQIAIFTSKLSTGSRSRILLPYDVLWLETRADCVTLVSFQLLDLPGSLIFWMHGVSPWLFYKHPVSLSHLLHSQFQIWKVPHPLVPLLWRQVSPWLSINPPRYASCSCAWELDAASDFEVLLVLLAGFAVAMSIPGLRGAIGLFADEELVGTWEDKSIAVDSILPHFFLLLFPSASFSPSFWGSLSSWNS